MPTGNQNAIHNQMHVYSSDNRDLGQVVEVYKDSFLLHRGLLAKNRYIPYDLIASVDNNRVNVRLSENEANQRKWEKPRDHEHHLGDPTQLFYDRGHGIRDPFDGATPKQA